MVRCDLCLKDNQDTQFGKYERCSHFFCQLCSYKRRDLLREEICLICLVDENKYTQREIENFKFKNLPWTSMRYEDVKIKK